MGRWWLLATVTALPCWAAEIDAGSGANASDSAAGVRVANAEAAALDAGASARAVAPADAVSALPGRAAQAAASRVSRPATAPVRGPTRGRRAGRPRVAAGPCVAQETTRYRVTFGIFGQVAEATLSVAPHAAPVPAGTPLLLHAAGSGSGNVLGFGKMDKRIETDFDARALGTRHWSSVKTKAGKTTSDTAEQAQPGALTLLRKRTGQSDLAESFRRTVPVLDPLSFLLRLRLAPPAAATVYEVLDGRALWLAKVSAARVDEASPDLLRLDGKFDPIYWSGGRDKERNSYTFSLFLTRDRFRTAVRLLVPYGLGEVRAELVQVERRAGTRGIAVSTGLACDEPRPRSFWRGIARGWAKGARGQMVRGRAHPRGAQAGSAVPRKRKK